MQRFPWKLFWFLLLAGVLSGLAAIPLAIELFGPAVSKAEAPPLRLPLIILLGVIQNLLLVILMIFVGLKLGQKLGLGAPLLDSWLAGRPTNFRPAIKSGLLAGIGVGLALLLTLVVVAPRLPNLPVITVAKLALWKRLMACFYGGVFEELLMRLFLLTLIAWIASRGWRKDQSQLSAGAFWIANVLVAILFGLGHLPSASLVMPITPLVVMIALALNGIAGVTFGWLYWKRGLEAAIVAHFTADIVLYVIGAPFVATWAGSGLKPQ